MGRNDRDGDSAQRAASRHHEVVGREVACGRAEARELAMA